MLAMLAMLARILLATVVAISAFAQQPAPVAPQTVGSETRTWTGTLIDTKRTNCGPEVEHASAQGTCPVSMQTTEFGMQLAAGNLVKFDEGGNAKALEALRKSRKGSRTVFNYWKTGKTSSPVTARVTGTLTSDTLNLESIKVD